MTNSVNVQPHGFGSGKSILNYFNCSLKFQKEKIKKINKRKKKYFHQ